MHIPFWVWAATVAGLLVLIAADFLVGRKPHRVGLREAALWGVFWVAAAGAFCAGLWWLGGSRAAGEFLAGYVTEKSLSVDNLFVFVLIMTRFAVPAELRQRVLLVGVLLALVLRTAFIALGAAVVASFTWVFFIFGAVLVWTAWKLVSGGGAAEEEYHENALLRRVRRTLPSTTDYRGTRLWVRAGGRRLVTPLLVVIVAIGTTDLLFALDSIPAIFGLTKDPYIVFTANAFALMGLRQLYFLIGGLLDRLIYLSYGLAAILGFIGVKLVLEALPSVGLRPPHISTTLSLAVIGGVLAVTAAASLIVARRRSTRIEVEEPQPSPSCSS
ncbi:TerC family protein [Actinospica sp.]|jgi:tellurite resistance protein TerC|uniref:TerC family protein n=1 Tax=Actinospica sp. TaxID=1872142 RepID=UPI002D1DAFAB|nr:TerC family protein [Actinospica sp.]HWG22986.1 TerC family protein [Actinospica sp.]